MATVGVLFILGEFHVGDATTRFISRYLSQNKLSELRRVAYISMIFQTSLGALLTSIIYVFAEPLVGLIGKPEILLLAKIGAFGILGWTLIGYSTGALLGLNRTKGYASILILEEILSAILPPILVLQGFGVTGALTGMIFSRMAAGIIGTTYVFILVSKREYRNKGSIRTSAILREVIVFSSPLWIANLLRSGEGRFIGYLMAIYLTAQEAGNYSAALILLSPLSYIIFPVKEMVYPLFSRIEAAKEPELLKNIFVKSVKYSSLLIIPATVFMFFLSGPIVAVLIPRYNEAIFYLVVMLAFQLSYGVGENFARRLLTAQGDTRFIAWIRGLGLLVTVISGIILVPAFNVIGLILAKNLALLIPAIFLFMRTSSKYGVKPPLRLVAPIYLSSAVTGLIIYLLFMVQLGNIGTIIVVLSAGIPTYLLTISLTKSLDRNDISLLETAFNHIPVIGWIAEKVLLFVKYFIKQEKEESSVKQNVS